MTGGRSLVSVGLLRQAPWHFQLPDRINEVPGMLSWYEKRMLYWLARYYYTAQGKICDLGAFLGASALCFATGFRDAGHTGELIYGYDRFVLGPFEQNWLEERSIELPPNHETLQLYMHNLRDYLDLLVVKAGDIKDQRWDGSPIEFLFVDIAKSAPTWDHVVHEFFPSLIPGASILILQDYLWPTSGAWHHVVMEKLRANFDYLADTGINSVVFHHMAPFEGAYWSGPGGMRSPMMRGGS
jgi:hypothetical protein